MSYMVVWVEYIAESAYGIDDLHNDEIVESAVHASEYGPFLAGSSLRITKYLVHQRFLRDVSSVCQSLHVIEYLLCGIGHPGDDWPVMWSREPRARRRVLVAR